MTRKLFIMSPVYSGYVTEVYMGSIMHLIHRLTENRIAYSYQTLSGDSLITRARNSIVAHFLGSGCSHLLMIDCDIQFNPTNVLRMMNLNLPVVGGIYPKKSLKLDRIKNLSPNEPDVESCLLDYVVNFLPDEKIRPNGTIKVKDVGTGFLMIERGVFIRMAEAYPELKYKDNTINNPQFSDFFYGFFDTMIDPTTKIYLSEDYAFARRWQQLGGEIFADVTARLEHFGNHLFSGTPIEQKQ